MCVCLVCMVFRIMFLYVFAAYRAIFCAYVFYTYACMYVCVRFLLLFDGIVLYNSAMFLFGYGRWDKIRDQAGVSERSLVDVAAVCRGMVAVMLQMESISAAQVCILLYSSLLWFDANRLR